MATLESFDATTLQNNRNLSEVSFTKGKEEAFNATSRKL